MYYHGCPWLQVWRYLTIYVFFFNFIPCVKEGEEGQIGISV